MTVTKVHCVLCHEALVWDSLEGAWQTLDGYDVCPTDRQAHDPRDRATGDPVPLYDPPTD